MEELAQAFSVLMIGMLADAHLAQDDLAADALLAGDEAGGGVADDGGLDGLLLDAGRVQGALDGLAGQVLQAAVEELAEMGHPHADDGYFSHVSPPSCARTEFDASITISRGDTFPQGRRWPLRSS